MPTGVFDDIAKDMFGFGCCEINEATAGTGVTIVLAVPAVMEHVVEGSTS
jgi:hypothetical protein